MAKKAYTVQTPVNHDGRRFEIGETIELDGAQAQPLLDCGAVLPVIGKTGKIGEKNDV
jgi:hypothetical protein